MLKMQSKEIVGIIPVGGGGAVRDYLQVPKSLQGRLKVGNRQRCEKIKCLEVKAMTHRRCDARKISEEDRTELQVLLTEG